MPLWHVCCWWGFLWDVCVLTGACVSNAVLMLPSLIDVWIGQLRVLLWCHCLIHFSYQEHAIDDIILVSKESKTRIEATQLYIPNHGRTV